MPKSFELLQKEFSDQDQEWQWTYQLNITFNYQDITKVTITSYYQQKGREWITNELILEILEARFQNKKVEPLEYSGARKVFKRETSYQQKKYRFIFWFKDGTNNHLWIRNVHPID